MTTGESTGPDDLRHWSKSQLGVIGKMAQLQDTNEAVLIEANLLRQEVERVSKRNLWMMVISFITGVSLLLSAVVLIRVGDGQKYIRSCVEPDGKCKQQGDKATAEAVNNLNMFNLVLHECLDVTTNDTELENCVMEKLQKKLSR